MLVQDNREAVSWRQISRPISSSLLFFGLAASLAVTCDAVWAQEQKAIFVPPPRTITDITAVLDQEKPDAAGLATMRAEADAAEPASATRPVLAKFYYSRCLARSRLGDFSGAVADCDKAVAQATGSLELNVLARIRQGLAIQHFFLGEPTKALQVLLETARQVNVLGAQGWLFDTQWMIASCYIQLGDLSRAETYVRRNEALMKVARTWSTFAGFRGAAWNAAVEHGNAQLNEARGRFREAEAAYQRTEKFRRQALLLMKSYEGLPPPPDQLQQVVDHAVASQGRMKARQGRLAEGEADVRRALLSRLKATGKYNLQTMSYVGTLANLLVEQGRLAEAGRLTRTRVEIYEALGVPQGTQGYAGSLNRLASILNLQGRWTEAAEVYAELDEATRTWPAARKEGLVLNISQIATLYNTNNLEAGLAAAERLLARNRSRFGEQHVDTALARGMLAIGLGRTGRDGEALREFKLAIPVLVSAARETDSEDASEAAAREQRVQIVIEAYIALLARSSTPDEKVAAAEESFPLADVIRGSSVQKALAVNRPAPDTSIGAEK